MNTIIKNKNISDQVVYWGIINGLQPYPKYNPNIIMIDSSIKFLEDYFKNKNIIRIEDTTSYSVNINPLKKEITVDDKTISIYKEAIKSRNI